MEFWAPCPTESMAIPAATPITMRGTSDYCVIYSRSGQSGFPEDSLDFIRYLSTRPSRTRCALGWEAMRDSWVMMSRVGIAFRLS